MYFVYSCRNFFSEVYMFELVCFFKSELRKIVRIWQIIDTGPDKNKTVPTPS